MLSSIKINQLLILGCIFLQGSLVFAQQKEKIQIMLVGFAHLNQMQNGTESASMFNQKKQEELQKITRKIAEFRPDAIMVEITPEEQHKIDSLYMLFRNDRLKLENLEYGASETYQVGFKLGQQLNLEHIYGIDFNSPTSQSLLKKGDNYVYFKNQLEKLQQTARPLGKKVMENKLSLYEFTQQINKPEMINLSYQAIFNYPAYVQHGDFDKNKINYRALNSEEKKYVGAEYISLFFDRNIKIYSNILNIQLQTGSKRIYVMMGQAHIGILKNLLEHNPNYEIVNALSYLN